MGREAHLARFALGRSAFQDPLRDEDGEFILGGQARRFDDSTYLQHWDERGHPQNLTSERLKKRFYKAQNEVLQACGVVVRKDAEKKKKRKRKEIPVSDQLDLAKEENEIGFVLKYIDNMTGDLLSWWICNLKKRSMVFKPLRSSFLQTIKAEFRASPVSFLFGGFVVSVLASILSAWQDSGFADQERYVDFLEMNSKEPPTSWRRRLKVCSTWLLTTSIEMPLELISTMQRLGFALGPIMLGYWRKNEVSATSSAISPFSALISSPLYGLIILHLARNYIRDETFWRTYLVIRQIISRPRNPSTTCIIAAETDEYENGESIVGIGRSLGHATDRRFYGPQSFWPAIGVAFPWIKSFSTDNLDKDEIKKETLLRCAMMEVGLDYDSMPDDKLAAKRAENIISNLESLGVDVEEDFFVDMDEWSEELELVDRENLFGDTTHHEVEDMDVLDPDEEGQPVMPDFDSTPTNDPPPTETPALEGSYSITQNRDGSILIEFEFDRQMPQDRGPTEAANIENADFPAQSQIQTSQAPAADSVSALSQTPTTEPPTLGELDDITAQTRLANHSAGQVSEIEHPIVNPSSSHLEWEVPTTPEPGIRRARSLSQTQTTPRPIRRSTETENDDNVEAYLTEVLDGSRKVEAKKKTKDPRESRVTRLSVFAADSLAWHSSIIITSFVLLPVDDIYYRNMTKWMMSCVNGLGAAVFAFPNAELQLVDSIYTWNQSRALLFSISVECLIRGAIWQAGCGIARYYGRRFHWGRF